MNNAFLAFDLVVDAGSSEEDALYGLMTRYPTAPLTSFEKVLNRRFNFNKFASNSNRGKVLSTAVIVAGNRQDVVDLLASRFAIDFCAISVAPDPYSRDGQVISFLKTQHLTIVQKYGGACVP